jgi:murein DD-endopeptidase MepM/ murein hydrolase activator NlpD
MRKAFLRSPVDFNRISSRFTKERYHPVLGVKRPHRGVDYAAPIGTPVKAAGDGKVLFVGTKGGYGRTIILQHGGQISTLYGHLSRFQRGLRSGARVRQGQIIGYVGKTGVATGPHLHYEFRLNGAHRNPLTVKLPSAAPIRSTYAQNFQTFAGAMFAQLDLISEIQLAGNEL